MKFSDRDFTIIVIVIGKVTSKVTIQNNEFNKS